MKTINKGNEIFIGENPVGYGLAERAGFLKKGYRQVAVRVRRLVMSTRITWYWCSSERSGSYGCNMNFNNDGNLNLNFTTKTNTNSNNRVRSVFAFLNKPSNNKI